MKKISVLGSTGSIGKNALRVIDELGGGYSVEVLTAQNNYKELAEQIYRYRPKTAVIGCEEGYKYIKKEFPELNILFGRDGLKEAAAVSDYDTILTAVMGAVGIDATIEAVKRGKRIALANKETLVAAGKIINKLVKENNSEIIPVDSEHSAVYQSLHSGKMSEVNKIILTASGGPFRKYNPEELEHVTLSEALNHPNWKMGSKITIDSATLVNKGLEVIEAHYLFNIPYERIDVVVHPESIIHSMVEFSDSSVIAQMGQPDMKVPIQYAFTYPDRAANGFPKLNLAQIGKLTFEEPKPEIFKGLKLAYEAGKKGETMPAVFNAANEEAVKLFMNGKIGFLDIYRVIEDVMGGHRIKNVENIEDIYKADLETRETIIAKYGRVE